MPYLSDITSSFAMIAKFLSFDPEKIFYTRHAGIFMNNSHTRNNNFFSLITITPTAEEHLRKGITFYYKIQKLNIVSQTTKDNFLH